MTVVYRLGYFVSGAFLHRVPPNSNNIVYPSLFLYTWLCNIYIYTHTHIIIHIDIIMLKLILYIYIHFTT